MSAAGPRANCASPRDELGDIRRDLEPDAGREGLVLALDQGGSSSRAVLFDLTGGDIASAHVPVATTRSGADRVEHDADEIAHSMLVAARDACDSKMAAGRPLLAAGLATQRSTVTCWDRTDGTALSSAISWQDRRHAAWLQAHLAAQAAWVRELTGLPLSPHYGASKLRWCLDELAPVRLALRDGRLAAGPLASFLLYRLCDERPLFVDPANASRTLLFDPALLDWSPTLLEAFGIPASVLPRCVGTQHDYGTFPIDAGRRTPVRACSGDQSAAVFAFGMPSPATAFANVGTGAFVQRVIAGSVAATPRGLLRSVLHAQTGSTVAAAYTHEGTVNGAGSALDWLARRTGLDTARALRALPATSDPAVATLLFMNGIGGLGAPYWIPDFPTGFIATTGDPRDVANASELQQLVAVIESIAFLIAVNVETMRGVAPFDRLVITGGFAGCDCLCQALSDVTGLTVDRPALREATARGIAYLAAGRPQDWRPVPVEQVFLPLDSSSIRGRFAHWRAAMAARGAVN